MSTFITRSEIRQRLEDWRVGVLSTEAIHRWAEDRYLVDEYETEDAVVSEVLASLDALDMNLLIPADVPALLELLSSSPDALVAGLAAYESYCSQVDISKRRVALRAIPSMLRFAMLANRPLRPTSADEF
jgi:hypothetical protein